jgi:hypothetical protein
LRDSDKGLFSPKAAEGCKNIGRDSGNMPPRNAGISCDAPPQFSKSPLIVTA